MNNKIEINENIILYNGDCFDILNNLINQNVIVDSIVTDPPYGILNHRIETNIDKQKFFYLSNLILKNNSFITFFGIQPTLTEWNIEAKKLFNFRKEIIWNKKNRTNPTLTIGKTFENISILSKGNINFNKVYVDLYETIITGFKDIELKNYINELKELLNNTKKLKDYISFIENNKNLLFTYTNAKLNEYVTIAKNFKSFPKWLSQINVFKKGFLAQDLVSFVSHNQEKRDGGDACNVKHPTVKSIPLMEYLIKLTTKENDLIIDPFMGSGTTGIACINTNRKFIGIELDSEYFKISCDRIKNIVQEKNNLLI